MLDYLYGVFVACAALLALLLVASLIYYTIRELRERRERNSTWSPTTRRVGKQTWIVVQRIHHNWAGRRILAEQLVAVVSITDPFHNQKVQRKERVAELRAAWLNHGQPETPTI